MRDRKMTKVLTTPWIRVRVTMSPLAMWATSWPSTAATSSSVMDESRPVETATRESLRKAPVANALGARSEEHTSELQSREKLVCRLLLEKTRRPEVRPEAGAGAVGVVQAVAVHPELAQPVAGDVQHPLTRAGGGAVGLWHRGHAEARPVA